MTITSKISTDARAAHAIIELTESCVDWSGISGSSEGYDILSSRFHTPRRYKSDRKNSRLPYVRGGYYSRGDVYFCAFESNRSPKIFLLGGVVEKSIDKVMLLGKCVPYRH